MNLPDSLACEQALGVWGGKGAKGGFRSLPPPPGSLLADAFLIKIGFFFFCIFMDRDEVGNKNTVNARISARGAYLIS